MSNPAQYAIELRDKSFNLKARLEPFVSNLNWEWNRIGGCGRCTFEIGGDYKRVLPRSDDDVRIYLPNATTGATLWYRGYVERITPILSASRESIRVECQGYFGWMERLIVHDDGEPLVVEGAEVSQIVTDLINDFVVPSSDIALGTVQTSDYSPDILTFKGSVRQALETLFNLVVTVEYGVDENLNFFWYNQDDAVKRKFYIGDSVFSLNDKVTYEGIVNKIYFEGGRVDDVAFQVVGGSQMSQDRYGLHEEIISNGSITTLSVANQFISGILQQRGKPLYQRSFSLPNTTVRFEADKPMGAVSVVDMDVDQMGAFYGTTASGGSNKEYGEIIDGGSGQLYRGIRVEQIDRVRYSLSPENGKIDAEIQLGDSRAVSLASSELKRIQLSLDSVRQRSI